MGIFVDHVKRRIKQWQQTWADAALAADKQEPLTLSDIYEVFHQDMDKLTMQAVEYWKREATRLERELAAAVELHERTMRHIEAALEPLEDIAGNRCNRIVATIRRYRQKSTEE